MRRILFQTLCCAWLLLPAGWTFPTFAENLACALSEGNGKRPDVTAEALRNAGCRYPLIPAGEQEPTETSEGVSKSSLDGRHTALWGLRVQVETGGPETMARQYLEASAELLHIPDQGRDLVHLGTRETPGGVHVRFRQHLQGIPVWRATVVVNLDRQNTVTSVLNGYRPYANLTRRQTRVRRIDSQRAIERSRQYLQIEGRLNHQSAEVTVYATPTVSRLAYRVTLVPAESLFGDWEVLVDATTGEIFRVENRATQADGTGQVFEPDPLTRARTLYGMQGFTDNGDADSPQLTAQLVSRTLRDLTVVGNTFSLAGPNAVITDFEAPFDGIFSQTGSTFNYTRGQDPFEAVMVYYHVDAAMRYLDSLGYSVSPSLYTGGIQVDPHGLAGFDNSHYLSSTQQLAWGQGGVDDAEDPDVIWHEMGHAIHDWITGNNLSPLEGLSEGFGDYWAVSNNRSYGFWQPTDPQYNWVFQWDGHNEYWPGRITNDTDHYPDDLGSGLHNDGQMLSSSLMQIWDHIGRTKSDRVVLEGLSQLGNTSNQQDMANAVCAADQALYAGSHLPIICHFLTARGYTLNPSCCGPFDPDLWIEDTPTNYQGVDPDTGDEPDSNMAGEPMWLSQGVWVRNQPGDPGSNANHLDHQNPKFGQDNEVYVTVNNRGGTFSAGNAQVRLYYANASLGLDWTPPNGGPNWNLIGTIAVPSLGTGESKTLTIVWPASNIPQPTPAVGDHFCLLARIVSAVDPFTNPEGMNLDANTRNNNNIAWRNVTVVDNVNKTRNQATAILRNVTEGTRTVDVLIRGAEGFLRQGGGVRVDLGDLLPRWQESGGRGRNVEFEGDALRLQNTPAVILGIPLRHLEQHAIHLSLETPQPLAAPGAVRQYTLEVVQQARGQDVGGVAYTIQARAADADTDEDGIPDVEDPDDDGDGLADIEDPEPLSPQRPLSCPVGSGKALAAGLHYPVTSHPTCTEAVRDAEAANSLRSFHYRSACQRTFGGELPDRVSGARVVQCRENPPNSEGNVVVAVEVCCR